MRTLLLCIVFMVFSQPVVPQVSNSSEKYHSFPLNQPMTTYSLQAYDFSLSTTCTVTKSEELGLYSYTIKLEYETDKKYLLSWNLLDWVLSQYPNAINTRYATRNLFPLSERDDSYTLYFQSPAAPLWFENTHISIFPLELSDDDVEHNKEVAIGYNGVYVSSYEYIRADSGQRVAFCLPRNLLVFTNGAQ